MEQALALDVKNGNTSLVVVMCKEFENVNMAYKILPDRINASIDHQFVQCHVIFDIKVEDFRHKTRLMAGDNITKAAITCTNVEKDSCLPLSMILR